ncbi:PH domain-containing protein [Amycolatopsis arida]|uniref:PH domain-containing protein n=1 Tax=Amycolatopsis arida TaxID=587909 RepID=UPI001FBAC46A|nr:PH domain-containing protein [Amycolatopsis arida]
MQEDVVDEKPEQRERPEEPVPAKQRKAVFRIPAIAMLAVALLTVCVIPAAFALAGLQVLLLVPIGLAWWILRSRTTATPSGLTVRTAFGRQELAWSELKGLALARRGRVRAVATDGREVTLPSVRPRHLPVLSLISGGRLPDPTGLTDDMPGAGSDTGRTESGEREE